MTEDAMVSESTLDEDIESPREGGVPPQEGKGELGARGEGEGIEEKGSNEEPKSGGEGEQKEHPSAKQDDGEGKEGAESPSSSPDDEAAPLVEPGQIGGSPEPREEIPLETEDEANNDARADEPLDSEDPDLEQHDSASARPSGDPDAQNHEATTEEGDGQESSEPPVLLTETTQETLQQEEESNGRDPLRDDQAVHELGTAHHNEADEAPEENDSNASVETTNQSHDSLADQATEANSKNESDNALFPASALGAAASEKEEGLEPNSPKSSEEAGTASEPKMDVSLQSEPAASKSASEDETVESSLREDSEGRNSTRESGGITGEEAVSPRVEGEATSDAADEENTASQSEAEHPSARSIGSSGQQVNASSGIVNDPSTVNDKGKGNEKGPREGHKDPKVVPGADDAAMASTELRPQLSNIPKRPSSHVVVGRTPDNIRVSTVSHSPRSAISATSVRSNPSSPKRLPTFRAGSPAISIKSLTHEQEQERQKAMKRHSVTTSRAASEPFLHTLARTLTLENLKLLEDRFSAADPLGISPKDFASAIQSVFSSEGLSRIRDARSLVAKLFEKVSKGSGQDDEAVQWDDFYSYYMSTCMPWVVVTDPETGHSYFCNRYTEEISWDLPPKIRLSMTCEEKQGPPLTLWDTFQGVSYLFFPTTGETSYDAESAMQSNTERGDFVGINPQTIREVFRRAGATTEEEDSLLSLLYKGTNEGAQAVSGLLESVIKRGDSEATFVALASNGQILKGEDAVPVDTLVSGSRFRHLATLFKPYPLSDLFKMNFLEGVLLDDVDPRLFRYVLLFARSKVPANHLLRGLPCELAAAVQKQAQALNMHTYMFSRSFEARPQPQRLTTSVHNEQRRDKLIRPIEETLVQDAEPLVVHIRDLEELDLCALKGYGKLMMDVWNQSGQVVAGVTVYENHPTLNTNSDRWVKLGSLRPYPGGLENMYRIYSISGDALTSRNYQPMKLRFTITTKITQDHPELVVKTRQPLAFTYSKELLHWLANKKNPKARSMASNKASPLKPVRGARPKGNEGSSPRPPEYQPELGPPNSSTLQSSMQQSKPPYTIPNPIDGDYRAPYGSAGDLRPPYVNSYPGQSPCPPDLGFQGSPYASIPAAFHHGVSPEGYGSEYATGPCQNASAAYSQSRPNPAQQARSPRFGIDMSSRRYDNSVPPHHASSAPDLHNLYPAQSMTHQHQMGSGHPYCRY